MPKRQVTAAREAANHLTVSLGSLSHARRATCQVGDLRRHGPTVREWPWVPARVRLVGHAAGTRSKPAI